MPIIKWLLAIPHQKVASKKQTPFSVWYRSDGGVRTSGQARLKEADAFQRLVCAALPTDAEFQPFASKKQTPFSVWYKQIEADAFSRPAASKKQTPFSVWYPSGTANARGGRIRLKEADAFQRLV